MCGEKGTDEGLSIVITLATCAETEQCTDASCIQDRCAAELDACVTSSEPESSGTPLEGSPPPGSVPADLVGSWAGARDGITGRLILGADGSGSWMTAITSEESACFSFTRNTRSGNVVVGETVITIYATSVVASVQRCSPPAVDTNKAPVTEELQWHRPTILPTRARSSSSTAPALRITPARRTATRSVAPSPCSARPA